VIQRINRNTLYSRTARVSGDPYWANVYLLCHFNSSSGTPRAYVNQSALGTAIENTSGTAPDVSSTQSKFGGFGLAYAASGNNACRSSTASAYNPGTGDFTEEFFFYIPNITTNYAMMDCRPDATSAAGYLIATSGVSGEIVYRTNNSNVIVSAGGTTVANQWMHCAVARAGTSTRLFIDGTQVGSTYSDSADYNGAMVHTLGNTYNAAAPTDGVYYDEWRLTIGVARYTGNFTPPTAAFPDN